MIRRPIPALRAIVLATLVAAAPIGCAFISSAQAQSSYCLSDSVNGKLLASVRSALHAPGVPKEIQAKADSAYVTTDEAICAAAVRAFNAAASTPVRSVYVVVVPGDSYVVMPEAVNGQLVEYIWFTRRWGDPIVMSP